MLTACPDSFDLSFRLRTGPDTLGPEVLGFQVGVFAVIGSLWWPPDGAPEPVDVFAVVHVPSGIHICSCQDFADAVHVADEVSRFSRQQPPLEGAILEELLVQLGPPICRYIAARTDPATKLVKPTPFREWLRCGS